MMKQYPNITVNSSPHLQLRSRDFRIPDGFNFGIRITRELANFRAGISEFRAALIPEFLPISNMRALVNIPQVKGLMVVIHDFYLNVL